MSKKQGGSVKDESPLKQYSLMITSTDLMFQKISESLTATGDTSLFLQFVELECILFLILSIKTVLPK